MCASTPIALNRGKRYIVKNSCIVHPIYGRSLQSAALPGLCCWLLGLINNNVALQQGVAETSTDATGRTQSMMACWEVVVSLGHQDMLGSWHQRTMVMHISQTGHWSATSHHVLTRLEFAQMCPSFLILIDNLCNYHEYLTHQ